MTDCILDFFFGVRISFLSSQLQALLGTDDSQRESEKSEIMQQTLSHIEANFKVDLRKLRSLRQYVKNDMEATTPMRVHLKRNILDMCTLYTIHYQSIGKEITDLSEGEEEDEGVASASANPGTVSEALVQLYFHLERCEQCIDGSELYMKQLGGLVGESRKAKVYVSKCLDIVQKSRERDETDFHILTSEEILLARRKRDGSFMDEYIFEHLYNQNYFNFVAEFRNQIFKDFKDIRSFTGDPKYESLFKHDCMEVLSNTLEEVVPPFLDFLTSKQQELSGDSTFGMVRKATIDPFFRALSPFSSPRKKEKPVKD